MLLRVYEYAASPIPLRNNLLRTVHYRWLGAMNTLLKTLYELLSFITEDAIAHRTGYIPPSILKLANQLCIELGKYLDSLE
jgi:hypothetical protein